jgi:multiple sugar transport system substrate-binding protein
MRRSPGTPRAMGLERPTTIEREGEIGVKRFVVLGIAMSFLVAACTGGSSDNNNGGSSSSGGAAGTVTIQFWHGQQQSAARALTDLVNEFNQTHKDVKVDVSSGGVTTDEMLPKVISSIAAGTYPDVVYLYGSWAANIAKSGKTVDLSSRLNEPGFNWDDFWDSSKQIVSPGGKVIGFPALIDNLSVIYNKKIFDDAGVPYPSADWTWDDFRTIAKELTDPAKHIYGVNYPVSGDLDTVWRFFPGLWQRGGQIISDDETQALFNSQAGVDNLTLWQQMATVDKSVFFDPNDSKAEPLFGSGHLAMYVSGPWEVQYLASTGIDWGDQVLPGYNGDHQTVSGPDNWVILNHDEARVNASIEFLKWLTAPEQELKWMMASASLPIRPSIMQLPDYQKFLDKYPGIEAMADNLQNAKNAMPTLTQWPRIVDALGQGISSVLLGKADPKTALDQAAQEADTLLAVPQ